jgi:membrane-bound lytic murein transglycosylase D
MMQKTASFLALAGAFAWLFVGASAPQEGPAHPSPKSNGAVNESAAAAEARDAHFLNLSDARVLEILGDPKNRVDADFDVPEPAKAIVGFWLKIYAKYSLYHTLIYDKDHKEKLYEVVDSRDLFQRGLSPVALEITAKNRLKRVLASYRGALHQLQGNPKTKFKTGTPGANLVRLWGRKSAKEWRAIEGRIRTQTGQRDRVIEGLATADRFFPGMESIFKKFGIPLGITRLPLVESSFNVQAYSKADAVGVWQFLEKSAAEYLVVDSYNKIDERLSPIKSTYAAAKMFKRNYKLLGDWGLAVIAYNHGAKNLIPIRRKYGGAKIADLLRMTKKTPLGYASRAFYSEFLAMLHAERYRDELYGLPAKSFSDAISIVKMKRPASIFEISSLYNISVHELRIFNPDIFDLRRKLPAGTRVVLPRKHGESLVQAPRVQGTMPDDESAPTATRGIASEIEFIEYIRY